MSTSRKQRRLPEKDIYRPLPKKSLTRGRAIAARYQIKLWREDGHWFGVGVEEPGVMGDGRTLQQCVRNLREALAIGIGWNVEDGLPVVEPIIDQERSQSKAG
jgi:predicted RNase H-like HicB family nuclease